MKVFCPQAALLLPPTEPLRCAWVTATIKDAKDCVLRGRESKIMWISVISFVGFELLIQSPPAGSTSVWEPNYLDSDVDPLIDQTSVSHTGNYWKLKNKPQFCLTHSRGKGFICCKCKALKAWCLIYSLSLFWCTLTWTLSVWRCNQLKVTLHEGLQFEGRNLTTKCHIYLFSS